jgi:hypothetical protein
MAESAITAHLISVDEEARPPIKQEYDEEKERSMRSPFVRAMWSAKV